MNGGVGTLGGREMDVLGGGEAEVFEAGGGGIGEG